MGEGGEDEWEEKEGGKGGKEDVREGGSSRKGKCVEKGRWVEEEDEYDVEED